MESFKLYNTDHYIVIEQREDKEILVIEKETKRVFEDRGGQIKRQPESSQFQNIGNVLGMLEIESAPVLFFVKDCAKICEVLGKNVYQLVKIQSLIIKNIEDKSLHNKILGQCQEIIKLLETNFYFSNDYKIYRDFEFNTKDFGAAKLEEPGGLTQVDFLNLDFEHNRNLVQGDKEGVDAEVKGVVEQLQKEPQGQQNLEGDEFSFVWNKQMLSRFMFKHIQPKWYILIIQGFVGLQQFKMEERDIKMILISKRSCRMGGTRFNARGVDNQGFVGNFVETEQIMECCGLSYYIKSLRGSVPIYWSQNNIHQSVTIEQNKNENKHILRKHFDRLLSKYPVVACVNLMSKGKKQEEKLSQYF